jgi:exosortase/archaeosortase family protein
MMNANFSFIILTLNEEIHLERLLNSISGLKAEIFVLDSGSEDSTLIICKEQNIKVKFNKFSNHPKQWDFALRNFNIITPWTIGLDADQVVSPELYKKLKNFKSDSYEHLDGIYFNRKNYFQNQWIKHGGYFPMYMLKMFRTSVGYSELSGNLDHRFMVPGKTVTWTTGYLKEENLKENSIGFWISKHNRYSDLLADEEMDKISSSTKGLWNKDVLKSPNQRKMWKKHIWQQLPLFIRPWLFIFYRLILRRGLMDGRKGILFHFLQSFWFRLIVDLKIAERRQEKKMKGNIKSFESLKFILKFLFLYFSFYYFNIIFISITTPHGYYISFCNDYLDYIRVFRSAYITSTAFILENMDYKVVVSSYGLKVQNHAGFKLVYSCLGYGICSCFSAFALSVPKPFRYRYIFLFLGITSIIILNICRLVIVAIFYHPKFNVFGLDHHDIFNLVTYAMIMLCSYLYLNYIRYAI